ncbi:hypothetical protein ACFOUP_02475 [Belliella kenyensis]|uniref:Yip1 domain-containing protein n=1 Tax=Belliella kenyensis TaxID=1472724 RepID=A0ABV8EGV1_9BACT|nr:hypothetical protein [Belliella kenyensis]MCH7400936.1 hypothetical protein [Belliella kenyensis]MDN3603935.1 hypothetical protein [Belliella kenyensis]
MRVFGLLAFYAICLFVVGFLMLDTEAMLVSELAHQVEIEIPENVLLDMLEEMRYWSKFSALLTLVLLTIKCFLMALVLYAGLFFANRHQGVKLGRLFKVAVYAESIIVIAGMVKVVIGAFSDFTYTEFSLFYPLSVLSFLDPEAIQPLWYYPLQLLNVFEIIYIFLLIYFFSQEIEIKKAESSKVVLGSYLFSMSFWLILILFLTLNFT